jgi:hypothetical protein
MSSSSLAPWQETLMQFVNTLAMFKSNLDLPGDAVPPSGALTTRDLSQLQKNIFNILPKCKSDSFKTFVTQNSVLYSNANGFV